LCPKEGERGGMGVGAPSAESQKRREENLSRHLTFDGQMEKKIGGVTGNKISLEVTESDIANLSYPPSFPFKGNPGPSSCKKDPRSGNPPSSTFWFRVL